MASRREIVTLPALLTGMGTEIRCTVNAIKVTLGNANIFEYARLSLAGVPRNIPDGPYKLTFSGRCYGGTWIDGVWTRTI